MKRGIKLNNIFYGVEELDQFAETANNATERQFFQAVILFLKDWFSKAHSIVVKTSGSTGLPKPIEVKKTHMRNSALLTCSFFNLRQGDNILLCMPVHYIAGRMMLVRAVVGRLNIWVTPPSSRPLANFNSFPLKFAAMVPMQVLSSLQHKEDTQKLQAIDNLLIGGGAINEELLAQVTQLTNNVYSSYGMTETVSHIAMRKLNGTDSSDKYYPLSGVVLKKSQRGTLVVESSKVTSESIETNDLVDFYEDGGFRIIGRTDNVINSGGVKIHVEKVEQKLRKTITTPFAITSRKDTLLGEAVVLLVQSSEPAPAQLTFLSKEIERLLSIYETPKNIFFIDQLPLTETKKINRHQCKELATSLFEASCKRCK